MLCAGPSTRLVGRMLLVCKSLLNLTKHRTRCVTCIPQFFFAFDALGRWVPDILGSALSSQDHILRDSFDFARRVQNYPVDDNLVLLRIDIKHFFMSGTASELSELALKIIENPRGSSVCSSGHQVAVGQPVHPVAIFASPCASRPRHGAFPQQCSGRLCTLVPIGSRVLTAWFAAAIPDPTI